MKGSKRRLALKLVLGWAILMALTIIGVRTFSPSNQAPVPQLPPAAQRYVPNRDGNGVVLYQKVAPQCAEVFTRFIAAETPEARNQFVLTPVFTASKMARFHSLNSLPEINDASLSHIESGLVDLPGGKAFEARWGSTDGQILETVFREENGEWRLDWEHFVRYSDYPWSLFLAGNGPDEAEFRLLARERLTKERKHESTISLVMHAPRFADPGKEGYQSPEILVSRDSRDGQLLDAAFNLMRSGRQVYGSKLTRIDPDEMIRVRVVVRRNTDAEGQRRYEISAVKACHWFSLDDPGVTPDKTQD